jgi:hypothetical protein
MSLNFERKNNPDGSQNTKYVDLLDEDKPLSGQKFACISFVSPENILKQKNLYFFEKFLKYWDFSKCMEKSTQFINYMCYKNNLEFTEVIKDFEEFVKSEKNNLIKNNIEEEYATFMDLKEEELEQDFNQINNFQTSVRGLKVRGVYSTQEEAELRCKMLREVDPYHNVYVGPVGMWMPWEPDAYKTGRVEYLEEELNELMKEKNNNDDYAKQQFEKRVLEAKKSAIKENVKIAKSTGNKLTQNINEEGDLVGTNNINTIEKSLGEEEEISQDEVNNKLFKGENVRTTGSDSPRTARKKMMEYYSELNKKENDKDSGEE